MSLPTTICLGAFAVSLRFFTVLRFWWAKSNSLNPFQQWFETWRWKWGGVENIDGINYNWKVRRYTCQYQSTLQIYPMKTSYRVESCFSKELGVSARGWNFEVPNPSWRRNESHGEQWIWYPYVIFHCTNWLIVILIKAYYDPLI